MKKIRALSPLGLVIILGACSGTAGLLGGEKVEVASPGEGDLRPKDRPDPDAVAAARVEATGLGGAGISPAEATQVTATEVAAAAAPATGTERALGTTVATLGLLERDGFWLSTPLVSRETEGRVVYVANGSGANVTLIPNGAGAGAGSQLSLATMQALGISLAELAELQVFAK